MDEHHVGDYLLDAANILIGAIGIAGLFLCTPVSELTLLALAGAGLGLVHSINSIDNGVEDIYSRATGNEGANNRLRDFDAYVGQGLGYLLGAGIDNTTRTFAGKDYDYRATTTSMGVNLGYLGYYAADIYASGSTVKGSVGILKDSSYRMDLTEESGSLANYISISTGPSKAKKEAAAVNGVASTIGIGLDIKDLIKAGIENFYKRNK